jgi:hypothetical protein
MAADTVNHGASYTLKANGFSPPSGKTFKEWSVSGVSGGKQPGEAITVTGNVTVTAVWEDDFGAVATGQDNNPNLMVKFGIKDPSYISATAADVTNTFLAVQAYINKAAVTPSNETTASAKLGVIALGDYVDLPSLSVAAYGGGGGAFTNVNARVEVVGVNSYNAKNGNGNGKHLVFQFKDIVASRRMNATDTTAGGYAASEMRTYLTGNFKNGLVDAGVPQAALWAPNRVIGGASSTTVADSVYLPTLWEVSETNNSTLGGFTSTAITANEETGNQGRLTIYGAGEGGNNSRIKGVTTWYWLASASTYSGSSFCNVGFNGNTGTYSASSSVGGLAPVFCVK